MTRCTCGGLHVSDSDTVNYDHSDGIVKVHGAAHCFAYYRDGVALPKFAKTASVPAHGAFAAQIRRAIGA